jgi:hypothetical protein
MNAVAGFQLCNGHVSRIVIRLQTARGHRRQLNQSRQSGRGADHRLHLNPVSKEHDINERDQLPEEYFTGEPNTTAVE